MRRNVNLLLVSYQFERKERGKKKKKREPVILNCSSPELATLFVSAEAIGLGLGLQIFRLA